MEETGKRIYREIQEQYPTLAGSGRLELAEHLDDAVELAIRLGEEGGACVLSPRGGQLRDLPEFRGAGGLL